MSGNAVMEPMERMEPMEQRRIQVSGAGAAGAVADSTLEITSGGAAGRPTLLFVHGYPDCHRVWLPLMEQLASDYRVATFDLRGVGGSVPASTDYHLETMVGDVEAVINALVGPSGQVHLIGHDWGSLIGWSCVDSHLRARLLSYTSISGPHLGLYLRYLRTSFAEVSPRRFLGGLRQLLASTYVGVFAIPGLAELIWRGLGVHGFRRLMLRGGVPAGDPMLEVSRAEVLGMTQPTLELYRQNLKRPPEAPARGSLTTPTLLIVATRDPFITPGLFDDLGEFVPTLQVERLQASHWVQRSHPQQVEAAIRSHVQQVEARGQGGCRALPVAAQPENPNLTGEAP